MPNMPFVAQFYRVGKDNGHHSDYESFCILQWRKAHRRSGLYSCAHCELSSRVTHSSQTTGMRAREPPPLETADTERRLDRVR